MPTLHRRNGSVKYVRPARFLEGLRPAVAIPATLFAAILVGAVAFALHKTPLEQGWVILRDEPAWLPAISDKAEPLRADGRFLFERAIERARIPRATHRFVQTPDSGVALAPAAGRVVLAEGGQMLVEHAIGSGAARQIARTQLSGVERLNAAPGMVVQRGEILAEGGLVSIRTPANDAWHALQETTRPAPKKPAPAPEIPMLDLNL